MAAAATFRRRLAAPASGWLPIILLVALVLAVVYSVNAARWTDNTAVMFPLAGLGIITGTWFSNRRLHSSLILTIGVLGGFGLCFLVVSEAIPGPTEIVPNFLDLFRDTFDWVGQRPTGQQPLLGALETSWSFLVDLGGIVAVVAGSFFIFFLFNLTPGPIRKPRRRHPPRLPLHAALGTLGRLQSGRVSNTDGVRRPAQRRPVSRRTRRRRRPERVDGLHRGFAAAGRYRAAVHAFGLQRPHVGPGGPS